MSPNFLVPVNWIYSQHENFSHSSKSVKLIWYNRFFVVAANNIIHIGGVLWVAQLELDLANCHSLLLASFSQEFLSLFSCCFSILLSVSMWPCWSRDQVILILLPQVWSFPEAISHTPAGSIQVPTNCVFFWEATA